MAIDPIVAVGVAPTEEKTVHVSAHEVIDEKKPNVGNDAVTADDDEHHVPQQSKSDIPKGRDSLGGGEKERDSDNEDMVIVTGYDASQHLLSLRDDFEPALTFRSIFLASILSSFQAVMSQIYSVSMHGGHTP